MKIKIRRPILKVLPDVEKHTEKPKIKKLDTENGIGFQQRWQNKQRANGMCRVCKKPLYTAYFCKKHAERAREYRRKAYDKAKKARQVEKSKKAA